MLKNWTRLESVCVGCEVKNLGCEVKTEFESTGKNASWAEIARRKSARLAVLWKCNSIGTACFSVVVTRSAIILPQRERHKKW
eukprot:SAG31_NODE_6032_length_2200_cov_4.161828_1_plen_83_part_00